MAKLSKEFLALRRKRMITALIIICALALAAGVVLYLTREKPPEKATPYTAYIGDSYPFSIFFPDDPSIFDDEKYLSLDRSLHVRSGMEEFTVLDADSEFADNETVFFLDYFDALEHGASERYDAMFTEEYYEKYSAQRDFTEQRVYDIHLTRLEGGEETGGAYYLVEYKISKNNGSFRKDIGSDAARPVVFELIKDNGEYKINDVHYISTN